MAFQKIEDVSDDFWNNQVNRENRRLIEEFLNQQHLSPKTLQQYRSALKIFAKWVYDTSYSDFEKREKLISELKPRDGLAYQNYLINSKLSNNSIKLKRSAVSSLCGYIELYYGEEYPKFRNIFTKAIPTVPKVAKKEKLPLSGKELDKLAKELRKRGEWQKLAYLWITYSTGCRREEARQMKSEIGSYSKFVNKQGKTEKFYVTHKIRAKGKGKDGVVRRFKFEQIAMDAIQEWLKHREAMCVEKGIEDDCEYLFVSKRHGKLQQLTANTFNSWCKEFSEILGGRPVHPHLFRSSRATNAVIEEGKDIKSVQAMLGHSSSQTTEIYIVRDATDDDNELYS